MDATATIIFGPVPSRRLGRSLGINNIPPKTCSYSCVYCQLGRATTMRQQRRLFYDPAELLRAVQVKVEQVRSAGEQVDFLTFVADGEPTLDRNLEQEITSLQQFGIPLAVITNASLIWKEDVSRALLKADWVSLKIDTVVEAVWRSVNRPHHSLNLSSILDGIAAFAARFSGKLKTETMLLAGVNDTDLSLNKTAEFLKEIQPSTAYLSIPIRPPAEQWARPPDEQVLIKAYQIFKKNVKKVEYLTGYEGNGFASTGNIEADLLSITAVHPMRQDAVAAFLQRAGASWETIHRLVKQGRLIETAYEGKRFYLRSLPVSQKRH